MQAFLAALGFLTRIPVPLNTSDDPRTLSRSIIFFPVVGGIIGALTAGLYLVAGAYLPRSVMGVLLVALPLFITGGIHFDGLMDTCDGLFSGRSRERSLEIMRDSRVGSMGVMAGILNVMLRYSILVELPGAILPALLVGQAVTGRWVMTMALHFFPYARKDGLGQGFTADKRIINIALGSLLALLIIWLTTGAAGMLIALTAVVLSLLIAVWAARKLGGLTGDVYGALNEVAENIFLLLWLAGSITFRLHT
ncbi:MAG: adenosylcobinamide-GDP ribazoletransferase [Syntrophomonadaceae bacterium]|nr:adenosylcobinamide-GDP ribazoletransferase [Syntrophomonadaceae bacterium]